MSRPISWYLGKVDIESVFEEPTRLFLRRTICLPTIQKQSLQFSPDRNSSEETKSRASLHQTLHPDTHSQQTHTPSLALWTGPNKEIDCARPIRFPREGIPDFNGINLGTLARGNKEVCFIAAPEVSQQLKHRGDTASGKHTQYVHYSVC